tara:strand:+ start:858 stop:1532 length:675 start_codon:yes stop_codon:yes gene_type:complete
MNQNKEWREITLALAGVFQSAALVERLAKTGCATPAPFKASIESLFQMNPDSTESVYGGINNMELGLSVLADVLHHHKNNDYRESLRYVMGVLHLQKKLSSNNTMLATVGKRLDKATHQVEHFGSIHDNVIANLADIYTNTLSTFKFRIQVSGDFNYLQQTRISNQIRALLFAGIRSSMLWRQLGGKRWQVIFSRKRLSSEADLLLKEIKEAALKTSELGSSQA